MAEQGPYPPGPPAADATRRIHTAAPVMLCQLCRRRVHKQRNGAWYHDRNGSVACSPGDGSGRKAIPLEVSRA